MKYVPFVAAGLLAFAVTAPVSASSALNGEGRQIGSGQGIQIAAVACNNRGCREIKNPNCRVMNSGGQKGGRDVVVCDKKKRS